MFKREYLIITKNKLYDFFKPLLDKQKHNNV